MKKYSPAPPFSRRWFIRKMALSAFVLFSFLAYALYKPGSSAVQASQGSPTNGSPNTQTSSASQGSYKNGTYTGPQVNVFLGYVQVQVIIQNGQISNVQFLQYPNDRLTSVQINSYAMPYLEQEAIQAQSANVNMISGATLTSEGFIQSLQSALSQAG